MPSAVLSSTTHATALFASSPKSRAASDADAAPTDDYKKADLHSLALTCKRSETSGLAILPKVESFFTLEYFHSGLLYRWTPPPSPPR